MHLSGYVNNYVTCEIKNLDIKSKKCLNCDLKIYKHILNDKCNEIISMSATVNRCSFGY